MELKHQHFDIDIISKLIIFCLIIVQPALALSQRQGQIRIDSILTLELISSTWLYQPGDNSLWANTEYNDSQWDTINSVLDLSEIDQAYFPGIGWFRLHFEIDSTLQNKAFVLLMNQQGASEIYLNGAYVGNWGNVALSPEEESTYNPNSLPLQIRFDNTLQYVLAIRYSNQNAWKYYNKFNQQEAGFEVQITNLQLASTMLRFEILSSYILFFLLMVFLVLGLMHLLLYIFYKHNKSNLYYSIFMLFFSFVLLVIMMDSTMLNSPSLQTKASYFLSLYFPVFFVPLAGFLYSLFYKHIPKVFWVFTTIAILLSILYYFDFEYIRQLLMGFTFLVFVEVVRIVIMSLIKKKEGAWIIGTGVMAFIFFLFFIFILILIQNQVEISSDSPYGVLLIILLVLAILSMPISMSIFLARDFAMTNKNLKIQLEQVKILSAKTIQQEKEKQKILENQKEKLEILVKERTKELAHEKEKTEDLLLNILPIKVVNDLKKSGTSFPENFENVTVYFSDIVGFTNLSTTLEPHTLINELNDMFTAFDDIMTRNNCERIKTIGDAYMAVCGLPKENPDHAANILRSAIEIRSYLQEREEKAGVKWEVRIGIHSGKVVGGVVGVRKYIYDVFGDTINTASRMESNSEPMQINISEATYELVKDQFDFIERDIREIKGKGKMKMYFLSQ